jgi:hypothetical protein
VPKLLTKRGPKNVAFMAEIFCVRADVRVVVDVNVAFEV